MSEREYQKQYRDKNKSRLKVNVPSEKKCSKCGKTKGSSQFYADKGSKSGLASWCKRCRIEYNKTIRDYCYASTKKSCQKYKNRNDNEIVYPDEKKCYKCLKTKKANDFYKCRSRKSGLSDTCQECTLRHRNENKAQRNEYVKKRRKNDPEYRMYCSLQKRLHGALKLQGIRKSRRTMDLVGCTLAQFVDYIESLWVDGMSWGNYGKGKGKWCIDHIKPCAMFNLLDIDEQKGCFHYTNLQPLWNSDNFSKSSWYNGKKYSKGDWEHE